MQTFWLKPVNSDGQYLVCIGLKEVCRFLNMVGYEVDSNQCENVLENIREIINSENNNGEIEIKFNNDKKEIFKLKIKEMKDNQIKSLQEFEGWE